MARPWFRWIAGVLLVVSTVSAVAPRFFLYECSRTGQQAWGWYAAAQTSCRVCEAFSVFCCTQGQHLSVGCCLASEKPDTKETTQCALLDSLVVRACACCHITALDWDTDGANPVNLSPESQKSGDITLSDLVVVLGQAQIKICLGPLLQRPPPIPVLSLLYFGCQRC